MPIGKLLANMAVPMMVSMLVQAFYNVVDSVYVSQLNENALSAISLAFPLQNLMIAFGSGTAVGTNALLSRAFGCKAARPRRPRGQHVHLPDVLQFRSLLRVGPDALAHLLPRADRRAADRGLRRKLHLDLPWRVDRHFRAVLLRAAAAIDRTDEACDVHADRRRGHQHHFGPDPHLRLARLSAHGGRRRGACNRHRPDRRGVSCALYEPQI